MNSKQITKRIYVAFHDYYNYGKPLPAQFMEAIAREVDEMNDKDFSYKCLVPLYREMEPMTDDRLLTFIAYAACVGAELGRGQERDTTPRLKSILYTLTREHMSSLVALFIRIYVFPPPPPFSTTVGAEKGNFATLDFC